MLRRVMKGGEAGRIIKNTWVCPDPDINLNYEKLKNGANRCPGRGSPTGSEEAPGQYSCYMIGRKVVKSVECDVCLYGEYLFHDVWLPNKLSQRAFDIICYRFNFFRINNIFFY